ncbi:MAG: TSUP family transporter [Clostridia bacterium]|nr:TSUP family transporter [Clostridia bacterium]
MAFYLYLILAFFGGIPAGMGMGGGTVTIPLLVLVGGVPQKIAQSANLFSFLPMSIGALKKHAQSGLLVTEGIGGIILPALLFSALGSIVVAYLPNEILGKAFGLFLIVLGVFTLKSALKNS